MEGGGTAYRRRYDRARFSSSMTNRTFKHCTAARSAFAEVVDRGPTIASISRLVPSKRVCAAIRAAHVAHLWNLPSPRTLTNGSCVNAAAKAAPTYAHALQRDSRGV